MAHNKLISKLQNYGIQGKTNKWINKLLKFKNQKVVLDGEMSDPVEEEEEEEEVFIQP